ncbi:MAG: hypothetical protein OXC91_09065 [Rhodobacteraceae bacterium]|nr:hypothetical protein [Paracoccaceae bacterium]
MASSMPTGWDRIEQVLRPIIASMAEAGIAERLSDIFDPRLMETASEMGLEKHLDGIQLDEATDAANGPVGAMAERVEQVVSHLAPREISILEQRVLASKPATLQSLALSMDVTRERIRQLQARLERKIRHALGWEMGLLARLVRRDLSSVLSADVMTRRLKAVLKGRRDLSANMIRSLLIGTMGYTPDQGMFIHSKIAAGIIEIKTLAIDAADDVGLVEEQDLLTKVGELEPAWIEYWDWLLERCRIRRIHGFLAIRNSAKARAKAALLSIGRPATKREVGQRCGLTDRQVGGTFSNIASVVRADRTRWGLKDWIHDEYDGIVGEIIQRIREDGGSTTTSRLLSEIPATFDVSPSSVRAYMQTPLFCIQSGIICIADTSSVRLRNLDDVIDGRNLEGEPYWTFRLEERYFRGYSAIGVPPEFLKELGCEPDKSIKVEIENIADGLQLSARWPLASTTGGSLGYLAQPLKALELRPGDNVRVTLKGLGKVALTQHESGSGASSKKEAQEILNQMIARRRSL